MYKPYSPPRAYKNLKIPTQTPPSAQGTWGSGLRRRSNAFPNKKNKKWPGPEARSIHFHLRALFFFFRARAGGGVEGFGARASRAPPGAPRTPTPARVARVRNGLRSDARADPLTRFTANIGARHPRSAPAPDRGAGRAGGRTQKKKKRSSVRFDVEFGGRFSFSVGKPAGPEKNRARPFSGATGARVRNRALIWFS